MTNLTITNLDLGNVILQEVDSRDESLHFFVDKTIFAGTILARENVNNHLVPFIKGGTTNGDDIPLAVLSYDVIGVGGINFEIPIRALIAGKVRKERLIIDVDGDASNVDDVVIDQLRDFSIIAIDVQELNILDNQ